MRIAEILRQDFPQVISPSQVYVTKNHRMKWADNDDVDVWPYEQYEAAHNGRYEITNNDELHKDNNDDHDNNDDKHVLGR